MTLLYVYSGAAIFIYMTVFFLVAWAKNNNSIVDLGWGGGFIVIALLCLFLAGDWSARHLLTDGLVGLWGMRLSIHLFFRNRKKEEDYRCAAMRQSWGNKTMINSFIRIFML